MSRNIATTIRMDKDLKNQFEETCASMGMNMSTAFNIFATQVVRKRAIPFPVTTADIPNAETAQVIDETLRGENLDGPYASVDDFLEALNA